MATYTALMNVQVDAKQAQLGLNNLNKRLTSVRKEVRTSNKYFDIMGHSLLRIEKNLATASGGLNTYQKKLNQATRIIQKQKKQLDDLRDRFKKLQDSLKKTNQGFTSFNKLLERNQYFASLAISAFTAFVSEKLVTGVIRITDEFRIMENRVRMVNPAVQDVGKAMKSVQQIARDTRQPLSVIANLYARVGRNSKTLAKDQLALIDVVSTVSKAFQIGGATVEESRNALVQFSQALASGRLQGDELRSILELAPRLAEAISKSIGITVGDLRKFASEGMITTEVLVAALRESSKEIAKEFEGMTATVAQSLTVLENSFINLIGKSEAFKKANETLGDKLRDIGAALDKQSEAADKLGKAYLFVAENVEIVVGFFAGLMALIIGGGLIALVVTVAGAFGTLFGVASLGIPILAGIVLGL